MEGSLSFLGAAEPHVHKLPMSSRRNMTRAFNAPLRANDVTFNDSSCMAGSSDMISPFLSYRFQHEHSGHLNERVSRGCCSVWQ